LFVFSFSIAEKETKKLGLQKLSEIYRSNPKFQELDYVSDSLKLLRIFHFKFLHQFLIGHFFNWISLFDVPIEIENFMLLVCIPNLQTGLFLKLFFSFLICMATSIDLLR